MDKAIRQTGHQQVTPRDSNSANRTPGGHTTCHPDDNTLIRKRKWHGMRIRAHAICTACHSLQHPPSPVDASRMHVPCSTLHHHLMHHGCMCLATPFITSCASRMHVPCSTLHHQLIITDACAAQLSSPVFQPNPKRVGDNKSNTQYAPQ